MSRNRRIVFGHLFTPSYCIISPPNPPSQASLLHLEKEKREQIASELEQRLKVIALSQSTNEEPEPIIEHDSEESMYDLTPPVEVVELKAPESDNFQVSRYFSCVI